MKNMIPMLLAIVTIVANQPALAQDAEFAMIPDHDECNLQVWDKFQASSPELKGRFEKDKVGDNCLMKFVDRFENTIRWYHPYVLGEVTPVILAISGNNESSGLKMFFSPVSDQHDTAHAVGGTTDVLAWYSGLDQAIEIDEVAFAGPEIGVKDATSHDIDTLKAMATAPEAILKINGTEVILPQKTKTAINEIIAVWEQHEDHFVSSE